MANEVSVLNIGNAEYPIFGIGVRLENDYNYDTNYYFLMGKGGRGDCSRVSTGPISFGEGPNGLVLNLGGSNIRLLSNISMDLNSRDLYLHGGGVNDKYVNTSNIHLLNNWMSLNTYPGTDLGGCSIEMLQEDNLYGNLSNAIMINSDAAVYDGITSTSYIYVNGPEILMKSIYDTTENDRYNSFIRATDEYILLNQISDTPQNNSKINLTDGKVTIDATNEVHIGDQNLEVNGGAQSGYITIGSNSSLIQIGSGAQVIWLGSCDAFGVNTKNNITLQRNNSDLGNCTLNIGGYSRIVDVGTSEDVQGICMTTGERSTGDWNSVDIYGTTFSIRQVHNCDTSDEYEHSIIMDEDGLRMQAEYYNGDPLGQIIIDANGDTEFQIHSETTLNIEGPEINIGATGGSSNIAIGKTYTNAGVSNCEILNSRICLCKPYGSIDTSIGFVFEGGQITGTFRPYRSSSSSSATVNLGGNADLMKWTNVYSKNGVNNSSDERLKNIVDNIDVNLDDLVELRKFKYTWKNIDDDRAYVGMSAQEVQKLYPDIVETGEDGYLSMSYERLSVIALAAIDKLHAENKQLKDRLTNFENLVDTILSRIN